VAHHHEYEDARDDLRSTNFFAAAKFPAMTFKSQAWKSTGGDT